MIYILFAWECDASNIMTGMYIIQSQIQRSYHVHHSLESLVNHVLNFPIRLYSHFVHWSLEHYWIHMMSFCELVNLEVLKMPNNKITELPSEIGNLISLRVLCLDRNLLQTLPAEMEDLHDLQELFLRHNEMQTLSHLPSFLTVLHVSSNQLHDFGEDFVSKCMNLKTLYANGNQLKSLPMDLIAKCNRLQRLVVSHNSLESVPDNFWTCTSCDIIWKPNPQLTPPIEDVEMEPAAE